MSRWGLVSLWGKIQDAVAPVFCVGCRMAGGWLCSACAEQILFIKEQVCYRCGKLSAGGKTCLRCRRYSELTGVVVATHYEAGVVREMIHKLKYDKLTDLVGVLGAILVTGLSRYQWLGWMVVPVPLHRQRLAERGFNQAELLACVVARECGLGCLSKRLSRVRPTATQTSLNPIERRTNVWKSFVASDMRGQRILLIDDVMTTGATLEDCARACKDAGARQVRAAVIARG